jgi:sensor domain CHASE-containing protein
MTNTGYLVSGEDGNFVCDEDEEIEYISSSEQEEEDYSDSDDDDDSSASSDGSDEMFVVDDEDEYVYKKTDEISAPNPSLRRVTRQLTRSQTT